LLFQIERSAFTIDILSPPDSFGSGITTLKKDSQKIRPCQVQPRVQPHHLTKNKQPIVDYDLNEEFLRGDLDGIDEIEDSTLHSGKTDNKFSSEIDFWNRTTNIGDTFCLNSRTLQVQPFKNRDTQHSTSMESQIMLDDFSLEDTFLMESCEYPP
jgi:hypothetical protein